ncbi:MAG: response regulator [bacterium]
MKENNSMSNRALTAGLRVLFVEDEPLARWVIKQGLECAGCLVTEADSCARALELLDTTDFDAVLLDHRLPDGVGLDILRHLRLGQGRQKAFYLTAEPEAVSDSIGRELGIVRVLSKPVDVAELVRAICGGATGVGAHDGLQSSHRPLSEDQASVRTGRFSLVQAPQVLTQAFVDDLAAAPEPEPWLAMDLSQTDQISQEVLASVSSLGRVCRAGGGRLCLIGACDRLRATLENTPLLGEVDLYPDTSWLDPAGRRASSRCERDALLGSVVREVKP